MKKLFDYLNKMVHRSKTKKMPKSYPFTEWYTYGVHLYKTKDEDPTVEFVDERTGERKTLVDESGRIVDFPGIEMGDWAKDLTDHTCLEPVVRFRTDFLRVENGPWSRRYMMIWQIQPDGRYWEDEDGFGGTSDAEICLYAFIDEKGNFREKFRIYQYGAKRFYEEHRRLEEEEEEKKLKIKLEKRKHFVEVTRKEMYRLYELVETQMPETGKCAELFVSYFIPDEKYEVFLTARHDPTNYDLRFLVLGVCHINSDCMRSYWKDSCTYEELKLILKSGEKAEEFVEDSIRLAWEIGGGCSFRSGIV